MSAEPSVTEASLYDRITQIDPKAKVSEVIEYGEEDDEGVSTEDERGYSVTPTSAEHARAIATMLREVDPKPHESRDSFMVSTSEGDISVWFSPTVHDVCTYFAHWLSGLDEETLAETPTRFKHAARVDYSLWVMKGGFADFSPPAPDADPRVIEQLRTLLAENIARETRWMTADARVASDYELAKVVDVVGPEGRDLLAGARAEYARDASQDAAVDTAKRPIHLYGVHGRQTGPEFGQG